MTVIVRRLAAVDLSRQLVRVDGGSEVHPLAAVLPGPPTAQQWREACRELAGRLLRGEAEHVTAAQLRSVCERLAVLQRCAAELPAPGQPVDAARRKALEAVLSAPVMDEPTWELWRGELQKWRWDAERAAQLAATGGPVEPWPEPVSVPVGGAVEPQLEGAAGPQPSTLQPTAPRTEPEAVHGACVSPLKTAADEASGARKETKAGQPANACGEECSGRSGTRGAAANAAGTSNDAAGLARAAPKNADTAAGLVCRAHRRAATEARTSRSPARPPSPSRSRSRCRSRSRSGSRPRSRSRTERSRSRSRTGKSASGERVVWAVPEQPDWLSEDGWAAAVHRCLLEQPGGKLDANKLTSLGLRVPLKFAAPGVRPATFLARFSHLWTLSDRNRPQGEPLQLTAVRPGTPGHRREAPARHERSRSPERPCAQSRQEPRQGASPRPQPRPRSRSGPRSPSRSRPGPRSRSRSRSGPRSRSRSRSGPRSRSRSAPRSGRRGRSRERSTEERRRGDFSEAAERHRGSEGRALGRKSTPRGRSPSPGPRAGTREAGRGSGGGWGRGSAPRGEGRPEERWPTVGAWAAEVHTYLLRQPGHSAEAAHLMKVGLGVPAAFLPKGKSVSGFLHWFDSLWTVADKRESRALTLTAVPGRPSGSDLADPRALPSGRAGRR